MWTCTSMALAQAGPGLSALQAAACPPTDTAATAMEGRWHGRPPARGRPPGDVSGPAARPQADAQPGPPGGIPSVRAHCTATPPGGGLPAQPPLRLTGADGASEHLLGGWHTGTRGKPPGTAEGATQGSGRGPQPATNQAGSRADPRCSEGRGPPAQNPRSWSPRRPVLLAWPSLEASSSWKPSQTTSPVSMRAGGRPHTSSTPVSGWAASWQTGKPVRAVMQAGAAWSSSSCPHHTHACGRRGRSPIRTIQKRVPVARATYCSMVDSTLKIRQTRTMRKLRDRRTRGQPGGQLCGRPPHTTTDTNPGPGWHWRGDRPPRRATAPAAHQPSERPGGHRGPAGTGLPLGVTARLSLDGGDSATSWEPSP